MVNDAELLLACEQCVETRGLQERGIGDADFADAAQELACLLLDIDFVQLVFDIGIL